MVEPVSNLLNVLRNRLLIVTGKNGIISSTAVKHLVCINKLSPSHTCRCISIEIKYSYSITCMLLGTDLRARSLTLPYL